MIGCCLGCWWGRKFGCHHHTSDVWHSFCNNFAKRRGVQVKIKVYGKKNRIKHRASSHNERKSTRVACYVPDFNLLLSVSQICLTHWLCLNMYPLYSGAVNATPGPRTRCWKDWMSDGAVVSQAWERSSRVKAAGKTDILKIHSQMYAIVNFKQDGLCFVQGPLGVLQTLFR